MAIIRVCQTTKTFDHHMMVEVAGQQDGYFAQKILLMRPAFAHYFWLRITRSRTLKRRNVWHRNKIFPLSQPSTSS